MSYTFKEVFYTLQGEGVYAGRPAVFARFTGCNLWSGREEDRGNGKGGCARWCDTDFVGTNGINGGKYTVGSFVAKLLGLAPDSREQMMLVVFTGGEPLLQLDEPLITAIQRGGFEVAIETNGTVSPEVADLVDWVCLSPKPGGEVVLTRAHELKLIWPQQGTTPNAWRDFPAHTKFLQPMWVSDPAQREANRLACIEYCLNNPDWRLSTQTHKIHGLQ